MIVTPNWVCVLQKTSTKVWSWRPLVMRTSFIFNYSISSFPATFLLILSSDIPNTKNETRNLINLFHCQYWIGFYLQNQLTYHTRTTSEWRYLECNVRGGDQLPFVWSTDRFKKKVKNSMYNLTDNMFRLKGALILITTWQLEYVSLHTYAGLKCDTEKCTRVNKKRCLDDRLWSHVYLYQT